MCVFVCVYGVWVWGGVTSLNMSVAVLRYLLLALYLTCSQNVTLVDELSKDKITEDEMACYLCKLLQTLLA